MKIVLHIGLHKTATSFLQTEVFYKLGKEVVFNPDDVFYFVNAIFTLGIREQKFIDGARQLVANYASCNDKRTLLISSEALSQSSLDMNFHEHIELIKLIFPTAEIILFLRNQLDWLESLYRESIKHGYHQSIEDFLGYNNGKFENIEARYNKKKNALRQCLEVQLAAPSDKNEAGFRYRKDSFIFL